MAKIKLVIPEACSEKWEEMKPTACGAFCSSCKKEVVDFTQMSDREIWAFFNQQQGEVCGRLKKGQLRQIYTSGADPSVSWKKYLLAAMVFSGISAYAKAENRLSVQAEVFQLFPAMGKAPVNDKIHLASPAVDTLNEIRGQVLEDSSGLELPGVTIRLKGSTEETFTKPDGSFVLKVKGLKSSDVIEFSFVGYITKYLVVDELRQNSVVVLEVDQEALNEVVYMGGVCAHHWWSPKHLWWKIKGLFQ